MQREIARNGNIDFRIDHHIMTNVKSVEESETPQPSPPCSPTDSKSISDDCLPSPDVTIIDNPMMDRSRQISSSAFMASTIREFTENHQPSPSSHSDISGRHYHCQRCLNHGFTVERKQHRCPYKRDHNCHLCCLVDKRRFLNNKISTAKESEPEVDVVMVEEEEDSDSESDSNAAAVGTNSRNPRCAKCRNHGKKRPLKGHKRQCPYQNCNCSKCELVGLRRSVMAEQVWVRRKQANSRSAPPMIPQFPIRSFGNLLLVNDMQANRGITTEIPAPPIPVTTAAEPSAGLVRPEPRRYRHHQHLSCTSASAGPSIPEHNTTSMHDATSLSLPTVPTQLCLSCDLMRLSSLQQLGMMLSASAPAGLDLHHHCHHYHTYPCCHSVPISPYFCFGQHH